MQEMCKHKNQDTQTNYDCSIKMGQPRFDI